MPGEYADFIHRVRDYSESCSTFEDAVDKAVDECIEQNILREILERSKSDMKFSILTEYDQEKHYKGLREEGVEEGEERATKRLQSVLAEKDSIISEQGDVISEKDNVISEKDNVISEKDIHIDKLITRVNELTILVTDLKAQLAAKDG